MPSVSRRSRFKGFMRRICCCGSRTEDDDSSVVSDRSTPLAHDTSTHRSNRVRSFFGRRRSKTLVKQTPQLSAVFVSLPTLTELSSSSDLSLSITESSSDIFYICDIADIPPPIGPAPLSSYATWARPSPVTSLVAPEADGTETVGSQSDFFVVERVAAVEAEVAEKMREEDGTAVTEEMREEDGTAVAEDEEMIGVEQERSEVAEEEKRWEADVSDMECDNVEDREGSTDMEEMAWGDSEASWNCLQVAADGEAYEESTDTKCTAVHTSRFGLGLHGIELIDRADRDEENYSIDLEYLEENEMPEVMNLLVNGPYAPRIPSPLLLSSQPTSGRESPDSWADPEPVRYRHRDSPDMHKCLLSLRFLSKKRIDRHVPRATQIKAEFRQRLRSQLKTPDPFARRPTASGRRRVSDVVESGTLTQLRLFQDLLTLRRKSVARRDAFVRTLSLPSAAFPSSTDSSPLASRSASVLS